MKTLVNALEHLENPPKWKGVPVSPGIVQIGTSSNKTNYVTDEKKLKSQIVPRISEWRQKQRLEEMPIKITFQGKQKEMKKYWLYTGLVEKGQRRI